jgi:hypothetical protein
MPVIDHVIYAVRDLAAAADRLAALGLPSYEGGSHPGLGTSNRIVPLGPSYIELLAPAPFDDRFHGWMIRGVPLPDEALAMSRVTPSGARLSWRLAGVTPASSIWEMGGLQPVLIEWDEGVVLPGQAEEPVGSLAWVRLGSTGIEAVGVQRLDGTEVTLR